ncbi:MAG: insulinase family protein [Phycisphaerales bacterium]|nr:insulinase family protein [Phycisphaerales bacterium]
MAITYRETTLPSGLRVAAEIDPLAQTAAMGFFVRTGARDEPVELMGISHLLEHMMFKGSTNRHAAEVNEAFDEIGARNNAFTSSEVTAYHAHTLPEFFSASVGLLADLLRPALRQEDLDDERKVVLEEIAMYQDRPPSRLADEVMEHWFGTHPLSHRVLGTTETVGAMSRDQLETYFRARYSPDNSFAVAAGNLDFNKFVDQVAAETKNWNPTSPKRQYQSPKNGSGRLEREDPKANRCYQMMLCQGPSSQDERRYAASILANIVGDSDGSRFYWALIETGLAEGAELEFVPRDGTGAFAAFFACEKENATRVEAVMRSELARLPGSITREDLARARALVASGVTIGAEQPAGRMFRLGSQLCTHGSWVALEDELSRIERLTTEELESLMHDFPLEPTLVGRISPIRES